MTTPFLLGMYTGSHHTDAILTTAMERWLEAPIAIQHVFTAWDARKETLDYVFDQLLPEIHAVGRIPMVTWEPFTPTPDATSSDVAAQIAVGEFDGYVNRWADRLAEWVQESDDIKKQGDGRMVYIRFAHEMNGDWYPWSPTDDPDDYVEMWRRVRDQFDREPLSDQVEWVWAVNHVDSGPVSAETMYPGDAYVDWVGIDGFNWGASQKNSGWISAKTIFDDMIGRLRELSAKPLCIPEVATTSLTATGHDVSRKSRWIVDTIEYFSEVDIQMVVWFNVDKETDWGIFGGKRGRSIARINGQEYKVYPEFREVIRKLSGNPDGR